MKNFFLPANRFEEFRSYFTKYSDKDAGIVMESDGKLVTFAGELAARAELFQQRQYAPDLQQEAMIIEHGGNYDIALCAEDIAARMEKSKRISYIAAFKGRRQANEVEVISQVNRLEMIRNAFRAKLIPSPTTQKTIVSLLIILLSAFIFCIIHAIAGIPSGSILDILKSPSYLINTAILSCMGIVIYFFLNNYILVHNKEILSKIIENTEKMKGSNAVHIFIRYLIEMVLALPKPLGIIILDEQALDPLSFYVLHEASKENGMRYSGNVLWVIFQNKNGDGASATTPRILQDFEGKIKKYRLEKVPQL